ncbi:MAG: hypothetical protein JWO73_873 [Candidatus Taylorbacteria bacterium]|nr:hypothetical protein [Candidatus Taylorbacteria bacterium]
MKIQDQSFQILPEEIKKLVVSSEIDEKIKLVGDKYSLHVDQIGELACETRKILTGSRASKDFVSRITSELEIEKGLAETIAKEINEVIFNQIRTAMQKVQDSRPTEEVPAPSSNSAFISKVEQAGGFTIEKQPETLESGADSVSMDASSMNREKILNGIENPTFHNDQPINMIESNSLADHMLSGTVAKPMTTTEIKAAPAPAAPSSAPNQQVRPGDNATPPKPSIDPYREPIA